MRNNLTLAQLFRENMLSLGRDVKLDAPPQYFGSTDMGNVSQLVPTIHPSIAVAPAEVLLHSPQFALAAVSETAVKGLSDVAKALAMTVVDLVANPALVTRAKEEFRQSI